MEDDRDCNRCLNGLARHELKFLASVVEACCVVTTLQNLLEIPSEQVQ